MLAKLLCSILMWAVLASAVYEMVRHSFQYNYDTDVPDLSNSYYKEKSKKPASGTSGAVNTPFGLYLDGLVVELPPNGLNWGSDDQIMNYSNDFSMTLFVRLLLIDASLSRELLTLKNGEDILIRLRDISFFQLEAKFSTDAATELKSSDSSQTNKWYFISLSFDNNYYSSTTVSMCVNSIPIASASTKGIFPKNSNNNYLNGSGVKAVYYSFSYYYYHSSCSDFDKEFDIISGSVVPQGFSSFCDILSPAYDSQCQECTQCAEFGCVKKDAGGVNDFCYTQTCPPGVFSDAACSSCYANSKKATGKNECTCRSGYTKTGDWPLSCGSRMNCLSSLSLNALENKCETCYTNSERSGSTCVCKDKHFNTDDPLECVACLLSNFDENTNTPSNCASCFPDSEQFESTCRCKSHFYDSNSSDELLACEACHSSCAECMGSGREDCLNCSPNASVVKDLTDLSGYCKCEEGFYDVLEDSGLLCMECNSSCRTCSDASDSSCLSCKDAYSSLESGRCTCKKGFYDADSRDEVSCKACHATCASCYGDGPTKCSSCSDSNAKLIEGTGCLCMEGFYELKGVCFSCDSSCKTCEKASQCLSCVDTVAVLVEGVCKCPSGLATLSLSPMKCEKCRDGTYFTSGVCNPCHEDCITCSSYSQCNDCKDSTKEPMKSNGCKPKHCEQGTFLSTTSCEPCHVTCLICVESKFDCQACVPNATKQGTVCVCTSPYAETVGGCEKAKMFFSLSVTDENDIVLLFTSEVHLTAADIILVIGGEAYGVFSLDQASPQEWILTIDSSLTVSEGAAASVTIINSDISEDSDLGNDTDVVSLHAANTPKSQEEQQAAVIGATAAAVTSTTVSSSTVAGFSTGSLSSAWALINNIQLLSYIPLMSIGLPLGLEEFFKSLNNVNYIPNLFGYFLPDEGEDDVGIVSRIEVDSSVFLMNSGQTLTTFFLLLTALPFSLALSTIKQNKIAGYFYDIAADYKWNYFIRFLIEAYLDLTLSSIIQLTNLSAKSISSVCNCALAFIFMGLCFIAPVVCVHFVYSNHHRFYSDEEAKFKREFGSLFSEFKNDKGFLSSSFYCIFFIRRLLYLGNLFLFESYPYVQLVINIAHSTTAVVFIAVYMPFSAMILNLSNLYSEMCITLTFILSGMFLFNLEQAIADVLQWGIMGTVYSLMLANLACTIFLSVKNFIRLINRWKRRLGKRTEKPLV